VPHTKLRTGWLLNKDCYIPMEENKSSQHEEQASQKFDWKRLFSHQWVIRNISFFLFLSLLGVVYIYNGHFSDKLTRKISATEKHIKELESEYKTIKGDVIFRSKASELERAVEPLGLKPLTKPPVVLTASTAP
jgi:hypothetical protein